MAWQGRGLEEGRGRGGAGRAPRRTGLESTTASPGSLPTVLTHLRPPRLPEEMQIFPELGRASRAAGNLVHACGLEGGPRTGSGAPLGAPA